MTNQNILPFPTAQGAEPTMSSREIAELLGSRHDKVRQSMERLAERGLIQLPPLGEVKNHLGQTVVEYRIGKRDSYVVVAQLSPEFTARLVDRWQELESRQAIDPMKALSDPATMRALLLGYTERVLELESSVQEMAPKVEALDRISLSDGSLCITDAAKTLQVRPKELFAYLRQNGWIYRRTGSAEDIAYQSKLASGVLEHKINTFARADGSEKTTTRVRITPKGLAKLAELLA